MYLPSTDGERDSLAAYIDQQLAAIRASIYGLTEEQARATPCRSALSIAGILKHTLQGMRGAIVRLGGEETAPDTSADGVAEYLAGFVHGETERTAELLADWDAARASLLELIAGLDPDAEAVAPPEPWHGVYAPSPIRLRYYLTHQIEEFARHAGHADIIREELDGVAVPTLVLTLEGAPANQFFTPFAPEPGTIVD
ncbi:DinB family protein [Leucobacter allii]|uniref:DinB family protein n=1 Tax=Leucobacter allii TaxID=2932247 RepID=A0ABY4FQW1_9MICO|nr:DUF664 domain-containing protein [Leucobacter allii]UOQ58647.1 DinB family protein [Leucobacter allii]UOR03176.1 DinB family protein [Leucobacter allii]